jgi:predicted DNA-binding mobile mystery protein A
MKIGRKAFEARRRLDRRLRDFAGIHKSLAAPPRGWIRAIREALGMTAAQLAARLGIAQPSLTMLERNEIEGKIQLSTLKRVAEAMNCTLVYALVPNEPLETFVRERARRVAAEQLKPVEQTMRLENQGLSRADRDAILDDYIRDTLDPRRLWDRLD